MLEVKYSEDKKISDEDLNSLSIKVGWSVRNSWSGYLELSSVVISVWDKTDLIGLGRLYENDGKCKIVDLAVAPSHQRKGIGKSITMNLEKKAKELGFSTINTDSCTKEAQNLFSNLKYFEDRREEKEGSCRIFYSKALT